MDLDKFLNYFNLIDAIDGVRGDLFSLVRRRGRGVGIAFALPDGISAGDIERTLARYRIPAWGRRVTGEVNVGGPEPWRGFSIRTEAHRADWARYIIWRAGGKVLTEPNAKNATWAARHTDVPPPWAEQPRGARKTVRRTQREAGRSRKPQVGRAGRLWARIREGM